MERRWSLASPTAGDGEWASGRRSSHAGLSLPLGWKRLIRRSVGRPGAGLLVGRCPLRVACAVHVHYGDRMEWPWPPRASGAAVRPAHLIWHTREMESGRLFCGPHGDAIAERPLRAQASTAADDSRVERPAPLRAGGSAAWSVVRVRLWRCALCATARRTPCLSIPIHVPYHEHGVCQQAGARVSIM